MPETVLAIAAHNDDQIIGAGGTLAKYAKQGKRVRTIVMSFGEGSHPHLKREVIVEKRIKESLAADKLLGGAGVIYFDINEGKFSEQFFQKKIGRKLVEIIAREKPALIFTHGLDDFHPDHRAVYKLVEALVINGRISCPVYSFDIWSLFRFRKRNLPRMVVDVTKTFNTKIRALLANESQAVSIAALLWKIILKDWISGLLYGYRYAEVFYRLK